MRAGLAEVLRVVRRRVVILTFDPVPLADLWLRDYFSDALEIHAEAMPPIEDLAGMLPNASVEAVPVPCDCEDGFFCAIWDRPEMHLDPAVRRASSVWHLMESSEIDRGLAALEADLQSGRWDERHGHLRKKQELDVGLRLIVSELDQRG